MRGIRLTLALAAMLALAGCSETPVITRAQLSHDDTRLAVIFDSCNAGLEPTAEEEAERVTIRANGSTPAYPHNSEACADRAIVQLSAPLAGRSVIDGATGDVVDVAPAAPEYETPWPYDQSRVSRAEYEAALDAMVACLMTEDPAMTARVVQGLDWLSWDFTKERDSEGNMSAPVIEVCEQRHLVPLR